jgi:hypothetical protein
MTDEQFKEIRLHLRIMIGLLGAIAGILAGIAWNIPGVGQ